MKLPPPSRDSAFARYLEKVASGQDATEEAKADHAELEAHLQAHVEQTGRNVSAAKHDAHAGVHPVVQDLKKLAKGLALIAEAIGRSQANTTSHKV